MILPGSCSDPDEPLHCDALRGGRFSITNSSFWHDAVSFANLILRYQTHDMAMIHFISILHTLSKDFALVGTEVRNEIGLGHSSILLHSLVSAGSTTSNVWEYFQGSMAL